MTTATERSRRATERRLAEGGRVIRVILSPAAREALERLTAAGVTITAAVDAALVAAAQRQGSNRAT